MAQDKESLKEIQAPTPTQDQEKKIDDQTVPSREEKLFNQMTEEELDKVIHDMVVSQFMFTRTLARALDGLQDQKELEKFIIAEFIKELEFLF